MSAFDDFFKQVVSATKDDLGQAAANFMQETTAEGTAFRADTQASLIRWQAALASGEIDQDMFQQLVQGQWDTAAFAALAKASRATAEAKGLVKKIAGLALDTAIGMIPGGPLVQEVVKAGVTVAGAAIEAKRAAARTADVAPAAPAAPAAKPRPRGSRRT